MTTIETTLCWKCNAAYPFDAMKCPKCGAANGNMDTDKAVAEQNGPNAQEWAEIQKLVDDDCPLSIVAQVCQNECSWEEATDRIAKYAEAAWMVAKYPKGKNDER